jgi:hypothetical protein
MRLNNIDPELYKCKAIQLEDDTTILHGFYNYHSSKSHTSHSIYIDEFDNEMNDLYLTAHEINPYTLCRNTGIKINSDYLYEYDLVLYKNALTKPELGYVEYDDFKKSYVLRTSLNYTANKEIRLYDLEIVGNVVLVDADYMKMQECSDERDSNYSPEPKIECRSTQRLNKLAKQFLPRN